jgi:ABC-type nickel/cobalt efflux system permease component RcnA
MTTRRSRPAEIARNAVLVVAAAVAILLGPAAVSASAHPLGNFTVNRYTGVVVAPDEVRIDHLLDLAEIPTAQLGERVADLPRLAGSMCADATGTLRVAVDERRADLQVATAKAATRDGGAGLPVLRVECVLTAPVEPIEAEATVEVTDTTASDQLGWREVTAEGDAMTLVDTDVPAESASRRLTSYPADLLSSPLDVRSARLEVRPGGPPLAASTDEAATAEVSAATGLTARAADLIDDRGPALSLAALAIALLLGATHALAPGHGKTVMAFYLAGQRTRSVRAAVSVGASVTLAHTGSVLGLGVLVAAGTAFVPARVYPWLTVASGVLIVLLGAALLRSAGRRGHSHDHGHGHGHGHGHIHAHGHSYGHSHGHGHGHGHSHGRRPGRVGLLALGLAGGLVPSPSAVVLLLAATAAGRAWFGAVLVAAFGVGMALTLSVAGLLAARVAHTIEHRLAGSRRGSRLARLGLSYGAAGGVCVIGAGVVVRALATV